MIIIEWPAHSRTQFQCTFLVPKVGSYVFPVSGKDRLLVITDKPVDEFEKEPVELEDFRGGKAIILEESNKRNASY